MKPENRRLRLFPGESRIWGNLQGRPCICPFPERRTIIENSKWLWKQWIIKQKTPTSWGTLNLSLCDYKISMANNTSVTAHIHCILRPRQPHITIHYIILWAAPVTAGQTVRSQWAPSKYELSGRSHEIFFAKLSNLQTIVFHGFYD
jgi:hypothetical protein